MSTRISRAHKCCMAGGLSPERDEAFALEAPHVFKLLMEKEALSAKVRDERVLLVDDEDGCACTQRFL